MPRTVKTIKDNDGNDLEVYTDNCTVCSVEMVFPKREADDLESMFPFLRQKIEEYNPCINCAMEQDKKDKKPFLSPEEFEIIRKSLTNNQ